MSGKGGLIIGLFLGFVLLGGIVLTYSIYGYFAQLNADIEALKAHAQIIDLTFKSFGGNKNLAILANTYDMAALRLTNPTEHLRLTEIQRQQQQKRAKEAEQKKQEQEKKPDEKK